MTQATRVVLRPCRMARHHPGLPDLRLGLEPTCRWVADGRNLEVKLGTSPTLTFSHSGTWSQRGGTLGV